MSLTNTLLIILSITFLFQLIVPGLTEALYFQPSKALTHPYMFITSIFLHANITHIFLNAYALFLFGYIVERKLDKKEYLILFFGSGIFGSLLYYISYLIGLTPDIPALGASGAIYGILAAAALLYPDLMVFLFFVPMKMKNAVLIWFLISFIGLFNISSGIAHAAHLGGLIFGYLYTKYLLDKRRRYYEDIIFNEEYY